MKLKKAFGILLVLALAAFWMINSDVTPRAAAFELTQLTVKASSTKNVKVKVKWAKSKKASIYRIYRSKAFKNEPFFGLSNKKLKYKKIKTVGSSTTKCTDSGLKFKRWYVYKVVAYKKSGSSYKKIGTSDFTIYTGPDTVMWDEYLYADGYISPSRIDLTMYYGGQGMNSSGIEIYRKETGGKYEKIKTIKRDKESYCATYQDESVVTGTTYKYKVRSYKKVGGKKRYGQWSDVMTKRAVTQNGSFAATYLDPASGESVDQLLIQVDSNSETGDLKFTSERLYPYDDPDGFNFFKVYYSTDGQATWAAVSYDEPLVLKTKESVVLKLVPQEWIYDSTTGTGYAKDTTYNVPTDGFTLSTSHPIYYNNVISDCELAISADNTGTLGTSIAEEYVH